MNTTIVGTEVKTKKRGMLRRVGESVAAFALAVLTFVLVVCLGIVDGFVWLGRAIVRVVRYAHTRLGDMKRTLIGLGVVATVGFALVYGFAVQFSAFAAGVLMAVFGSGLFYVIVKFGHSEIDLIKRLEEGNEAIPKHFSSYAFIIAAAIVGALLAGF